MQIQVQDVALDGFIEDAIEYIEDHLNLVPAADGAVLCKLMLDIFGKRLSPRMFERLRFQHTKQVRHKGN